MYQIKRSSLHFGVLLRSGLVFGALCLLVFSGCRTTKSKEDLSGLGMLYQNMTAHYNGYFNATEIMKESFYTLDESYQDNYNQLLPVHTYAAVDDPGSVTSELDNAIKKASVVISLHRPSKWTDDCYLLIGQAQYLKQDYESAQKTLEYLTNNFDKYGNSRERVEKKEEISKKERQAQRIERIKNKRKEIEEKRKEQAKDRKERQKEAKKNRQEQIKERKQDKKSRDKANKNKAKQREKDRKNRVKERNRLRKEREKARKQARKNPGKKPTSKSTSTDKKETKEEPKESQPTKFKETRPTKSETQKAVEPKEPETQDKFEEEEKEPKKKKNKNEKEQKVKDGPLAHEAAYFQAKLWLAKTYVERDFVIQADRIFKELAESNEVNDDVKRDLYPSIAHYYITRNDYQNAAQWLERAIEVAKKRDTKARYAFILGQLNSKNGSGTSAVANYKQAAKWTTDYEMAFHAKMNSQMASLYSSGKSVDQVAKSLERLINDEKNDDFKDQIYLQMARSYLEAKRTDEAKQYLDLALEHAKTGTQKAEIHYILANIHYDRDEFIESYTHYASALKQLNKDDLRYREIKDRAEALMEIAKLEEELYLQDSLFMLASLSEEELRVRASKILEKRAEKIEAAQKTLKEQAQAPAFSISTSAVASSNQLPTNFFAYDEKKLRQGERTFARVWGSRALVDDWRRTSQSELLEEIESLAGRNRQ